jgi:hypothetical protein
VEDLNGNINSTTALAGPVRSVDNLAPRILNLTHSNITVFNRTLDRTSGETSYEAGTSWFNASFELEKHEDEVSIGWYLDGRSIGNNYSLSLDISSVAQGHHNLRLELIDPPFHITEDINFTVVETRYDSIGDDFGSRDTFWVFTGLIGVAALLLGLLVYFLVIRPRGRKKEEENVVAVKGPKEMKLAKIHLKKKVVAVGAWKGRRKTRKNVDVKDRLYYLEDNVGKQFALKKKHYKPEKAGPCPMKDLPRSDFACPESVVEKCGLTCSQKSELNIPMQGKKNSVKELLPPRKAVPFVKSMEEKTAKKGKGQPRMARKKNGAKANRGPRGKKRKGSNGRESKTKPGNEKKTDAGCLVPELHRGEQNS